MKGDRPVRALLLAVALGTAALGVVAQTSPVAAVVPTCTLCAGGEYQPLRVPVRVFSTITNTNDVAPIGRKAIGVGAGTAFSIDLLGLGAPTFVPHWLPNTVTAAGDVLGAMVSVTVQAPTHSGSLTAYATGSAKPIASSVNFVAGRSVSNTVLVRTNSAGRLTVSLAGTSAGLAHVTIDVLGWFSASSFTNGTPDDLSDERGARLTNITRKRMLDTRNGAAADTPIGPGATLTLPITGAPTGAVAVLMNLTAIQPTATTMLAVVPTALKPGRAPGTQNLNIRAGATQSVLVPARIGPDGRVRIYNRSGNTNVMVDVLGYFTAGALETTRAGRVVPLTLPFRSFDTRVAAFGKVPLGPGQAEDWSFAAFSNSVNIGGSPLGKQTALLGNLTNASLARSISTVPVNSSLTMYPKPSVAGTKPPIITNLSSAEGSPVSNLAVATFDAKQIVRVYNAKGYAHYAFDVYAVVLGD